MRTLFRLSVAAASLAGLAATLSAQPAMMLPRASPSATVSQALGYTTATVSYSRPGVKGRAIWGGLVPYGKVWRAGANEATTVEFTTDVRIGGKALAKGTYALFVLPAEKEWTFIFSNETKAWGSFAYDPKDDVLRVTAVPQAAPPQERLEIGFEDLSDSGATLYLHWDKAKAGVPLVVEFLETAKARIKEGLPKAKADDPYPWMNAARFYWTYKVDRKQALAWMDKSIAIKPVYNNLWAKAEMLAEDGKLAEAKAAGKLAREAAAKDPNGQGQVAVIDAAMAQWDAPKKK
jgi:hypothetical protein